MAIGALADRQFRKPDPCRTNGNDDVRSTFLSTGR